MHYILIYNYIIVGCLNFSNHTSKTVIYYKYKKYYMCIFCVCVCVCVTFVTTLETLLVNSVNHKHFDHVVSKVARIW